MITINSYLHREILSDIIRRWMYGDVQPSDTNLITQIVHFNNVYVSRYLENFSQNFFTALHHSVLHTKPASLKSDLKDIITVNPAYRNERIEELISNYQTEPGRSTGKPPFTRRCFSFTGTALTNTSAPAVSSACTAWRRRGPDGSSTGCMIR